MQINIYIYIYAFSRRFYPKRLTLALKLECNIQVTVSTFYQLLISLGIEPMILALLAPCSTSWATGKLNLNRIIIVNFKCDFFLWNRVIMEISKLLLSIHWNCMITGCQVKLPLNLLNTIIQYISSASEFYPLAGNFTNIWTCLTHIYWTIKLFRSCFISSRASSDLIVSYCFNAPTATNQQVPPVQHFSGACTTQPVHLTLKRYLSLCSLASTKEN